MDLLGEQSIGTEQVKETGPKSERLTHQPTLKTAKCLKVLDTIAALQFRQYTAVMCELCPC